MPLHLTAAAVASAEGPGDADVVATLIGPEAVEDPPAPFTAGLLAVQGFEGKAGQVTTTAGDGHGGAASTVSMLVGVGDEPDLAALRRAGGAAVRAAGKGSHLAIVVGDHDPEPVVEGALLGSYRFTAHKGDPGDPPTLERIAVVGAELPTRAGVVAEAVAVARDLANEPGGTLTPAVFAERVSALAADAGLDVEVWEKDRIEAERFGGLVGVNAGSTEPPRVLVMRHRPASGGRRVALVGKGITFDSGGLSIKSGKGMESMKSDKSGAAAVVGACLAAARLDAPSEVTGIVMLTDNMPSGSATRPGDVLTIRNGTTVEVLNTDAEGRLVLADGLSWAAEQEPDLIVDAATLTGACIAALGGEIAGVFGGDDAVAEVSAAAERAGERVWRLPLPESYRSQLDSATADLRNIGTVPQGGASMAALFLREFVGDSTWAHLDIAGPAFTDDADAADSSKGGTGFGVRTMLALCGR